MATNGVKVRDQPVGLSTRSDTNCIPVVYRELYFLTSYLVYVRKPQFFFLLNNLLLDNQPAVSMPETELLRNYDPSHKLVFNARFQ